MTEELFPPLNSEGWPLPEGIPAPMDRSDFLRRLAEDFSISRIYYPGSCDNMELAEDLGREKVFHLDKNIQYSVPKFVRGRMENSPFLDGVFDAVFLQDVGADEEELADVLRTLRPNGIVIHSWSACCDYDLDLLKKHPQMEKLDLDYWNEDFSVFRKVEDGVVVKKLTPGNESLSSNPTAQDLWDYVHKLRSSANSGTKL